MVSDSNNPDPRVNAYRPDLADIALRALVKAERYVEPSLRQCVQGVVPMLAEPSVKARRVSEIRYGEFLDVFEERKDGFVWVQNRSDHYVGYLPSSEGLIESIASLSNRIRVLHTFVYSEPDIKSPLMDRLTLGSYVGIMRESGDFVELASGGYIFAKHVASADDVLVPDYVYTAGRLLGVPYCWGGRTPLGIDGAGLVQLVLEMAGLEVPRDGDLQREAFGKPLEKRPEEILWRRGNIVFFEPHHVGIMTGPDHIIDASEKAMQVVGEPLRDVLARGYKIIALGIPSESFRESR